MRLAEAAGEKSETITTRDGRRSSLVRRLKVGASGAIRDAQNVGVEREPLSVRNLGVEKERKEQLVKAFVRRISQTEAGIGKALGTKTANNNNCNNRKKFCHETGRTPEQVGRRAMH